MNSPKDGYQGKKLRRTACASMLMALFSLGSTQTIASGSCYGNQQKTPMKCDTVIVGGGPAGLYMAYELTNPSNHINYGTVCLFEKNDYYGGRIIDKTFADKKGATSGTTGTAAYRMYNYHYTNHLYDKVLGMGAVREDSKVFQAVSALNTPAGLKKGFYTGNTDSFAQFFDVFGGRDTENKVFDSLLCGVGVAPSKQIPLINTELLMDGSTIGDPNFESIGDLSTTEYLEKVVGKKRADHFKAVYRFKSDFLLPIDAAAYMKFNSEDFATFSGNDPIYPIPGHSALINGLVSSIGTKAKLFKNETVHEVSRENASGGYKFEVITDDYRVAAKRVILAAEAPALKNIDGDVIKDITKQKFYKAIIGPSVTTVTNQWNTKWWVNRQADLKNLPGRIPGNEPSTDDVRRGISNFMIDGKYCMNSTELSATNHHDNLQVSRSVYTDNNECADAWKELYDDGGMAAVNQKVLKGLRILFPKVFDGTSNEPKIVDSKFTYVPAAWFIVKRGSLGKGITNETLDAWSRNPLPGEKVHLIGDSYFISFGWSASAFMSAAKLIDMLYPSVDLNGQFPTDFSRVKCKVNTDGSREVYYDHL